MLYIAAILIIAGLALFVVAPLLGGVGTRSGGGRLGERQGLEHQRAQALQALTELEFDREMRKISQSDSDELRHRFEQEALGAMSRLRSLDDASSSKSEQLPLPVEAQPAARGRPVRFCPQCGAKVVIGKRFCANCGTQIVRTGLQAAG